MNRLALIALAAAPMALASPAVFAQAAPSGGIPGDFAFTGALATDYTFRGLSQTDGNPTAQATIDYTFPFSPDLSLYAGIFGSNVDFDDGDEANIEIDLYGGLKGAIGNVSWQGGVIYYAYPGAEVGGAHYDYLEVAGKLGYDFGMFSVTGGLNYSGDYFFKTGTGVYMSGDVSVPLPALPFDMGIGLHVGHQWIEDNSRFGTPDYTDWSIGLSGKIEGFAVALQYIDTSIDGAACFPGTGLTGTCDARGVLSVSRTF